MSGFLEFGLVALIGFIFTNVAGSWMLMGSIPPAGPDGANEWKKLEEGISVEGAKLVTPKVAEKTPVA